MLRQMHIPLFAGNKNQTHFIEAAFPGIETIHLDGYNIGYAKSKALFLPKLLYQVPHILRAIQQEQAWLQKLITERQIDGIISDNRYGLYHSSIPNVILTHQLRIQTGMGAFANDVIQKGHYRFLQRFNECWVVDALQVPGLSGELAHPKQLPANYKYIGLLSQMDEMEPAINPSDYVFILLSGPEPQRSMLHDILWKQCVEMDRQIVFIAGSRTAIAPSYIPPHIRYYAQAGQDILGPLLRDAALVICRSGYSTLMDLVTLRKKAILIPTPGQTEQEYLGRILRQSGIFHLQHQQSINLREAVNNALASLPYDTTTLQDTYTLHQPVLKQWIDNL